ncbi:MAG TPA: hypothetical protein VJ779_08175, partial [Acetobacteraceae bacterium]|nr:hypothetical protein [Acetobacteraceae bacterium]
AAGGAVQRGGESAGARLEHAAGDVGTRAEALAQETGRLLSGVDGLIARVGELQQATGQAARPLAATAADLRAAGEAATASVQPLREIAAAVAATIEQLRGVAQRLQTTGASTESMAQAVTGAAQRFEGVDHELARVVEALQAGLRNFTAQVNSFVSGTDQNLAKAAHALGSAVKQLEETLEEHTPRRTGRPGGH